jgi:hypothetical protein
MFHLWDISSVLPGRRKSIALTYSLTDPRWRKGHGRTAVKYHPVKMILAVSQLLIEYLRHFEWNYEMVGFTFVQEFRFLNLVENQLYDRVKDRVSNRSSDFVENRDDKQLRRWWNRTFLTLSVSILVVVLSVTTPEMRSEIKSEHVERRCCEAANDTCFHPELFCAPFSERETGRDKSECDHWDDEKKSKPKENQILWAWCEDLSFNNESSMSEQWYFRNSMEWLQCPALDAGLED